MHVDTQRHLPKMRPPFEGITRGSSLAQMYSMAPSATINGYMINHPYPTVNGYPLNNGVYDNIQGRGRFAMLPGNMYSSRY